MPLTIVFVHGWSVTNVNTYGELPLRLRAEASNLGINLQIKDIYLGKYISFHDEVRVTDISRAFEAAVQQELQGLLSEKERFICITHSTGGPVVRNWWQRYYPQSGCPMSHLIMMAPANFGSALAQLGKARVGRLKSWLEGVEPGQGVLDWLELGSSEAWLLNFDWISHGESSIGPQGVFPFVLTGQYIDRKLYDHLNTYTGELGSDGVVRVAAANLEGRFIRLKQPLPGKNSNGELITDDLEIDQFLEGPAIPLRVLTNKSHSGDVKGIMNSVTRTPASDASSETIKAILDCIQVSSLKEYKSLYEQFAKETDAVQRNEKVEIEKRLLLSDGIFIHDRFSMVIFRVVDSEGYAVKDYDLLITAGEQNDPNHLPPGFFADRQRNRINSETITYFFNYDLMNGDEEVKDKEGNTVRQKLKGIDSLGFMIHARPDSGFVHYLPCKINAKADLFDKVLVGNSSTQIEICLQRIVHKPVFELDPLNGNSMPTQEQGSFKDTEPGDDVIK